jgi:hypothetical protein
MSFVGELHAALDVAHRDESAEAVHTLVANALQRLDPAAVIRRTDYFTHTFVPDLVLRWTGQDAMRQERHVHLRFNVTSGSFAQDLDLLGGESPLFLGMTDTARLGSAAWRTDHPTTDGSLITQSPAIDELDATAGSEARARRATSILVRAGRGLLDETSADEIGDSYVAALTAAATSATEPVEAGASVASTLSVFGGHLTESGQLELERALQSEWIRSGGDPYEFPASTPWNPALLDDVALRELLTGLLENAEAVQPETWQRNAGFVRVEELGRLLGDLRGGGFNAMALALLPGWTAKWLWAHDLPSPSLFAEYQWIIVNGIVGFQMHGLEAFFADDGRHFKDKEGGNRLPSLAESRQMLAQPGLVQVGLLGAFEGLRYEPMASSADAFTRLRNILSDSGASDYRVRSVTTIVPGTDAVADVDLDRQVVDLHGQSTPVSTLARMAARFFSQAIRPESLDHFLATGEALPEPTVA